MTDRVTITMGAVYIGTTSGDAIPVDFNDEAWEHVGYTASTNAFVDLASRIDYAAPVFRDLSHEMTMTLHGDNRAVRYLLAGKPEKWMHKRARDFRADRRKYRRWAKESGLNGRGGK